MLSITAQESDEYSSHPQLEEVVQNLGFYLAHLAISPFQTIFSFSRSLQVTVPKKPPSYLLAYWATFFWHGCHYRCIVQ